VAEAFAQALRRGDEIRDAERWIWRTVFRVAAGELKERSRSVPMTIERTYEMEEPARELVAALARLSERQRAAVVLHHAVGYPIRAAIVGSTPAAVKVHLMRGRRRLRELLERPMTDLDERFRSLGRAPVPDLWDEIHRREPSPASGPPRGRRFLVAAVAFAFAITGGSLTMWVFQPGTAPPNASGGMVRNGAIAFTSGDGGYHIATVTVDGAVTELSEPSGEEYDLSPVWSPDGTAIAFLRYTEYAGAKGEDAYDYELVVSRPDGTGIIDLDQPAADFSWSDDGSAIVFSAFRKGSDYDVLVVRPDGSDRTTIVATRLSDVEPRWSPARDAIVFVSHPVLDRDPGDADVYIVRANGT
jgi:hypothetical protein